jgi:hypothetical protein
LCPIYEKLIISFVKLNVLAGRQWEVSVAAGASHSWSVEYTVFIKKIPCESVERERESNFAFTRQVFGHLESANVRGLNEQHFHDLRK